VFSREVFFSSSIYKVLDLLSSFELLRKEMENEFLRFESLTSEPKADIIPIDHGSNNMWLSKFVYLHLRALTDHLEGGLRVYSFDPYW
jgi:hypothetical protein